MISLPRFSRRIHHLSEDDPMLHRLFATRHDPAPLLARLVLGAVMLPHGAQHALGWFGGYGFSGTLGWMTDTLGFPMPLAALAIVIELVAPVALLFGVGGRLAAAGIFGLMLGAASTHAANGFFMNWFGAQPAGTEGFEYHLLALSLAAVVMIAGSGAASVDRALAARIVPGRRISE
jgi:putative oxidoreductase